MDGRARQVARSVDKLYKQRCKRCKRPVHSQGFPSGDQERCGSGRWVRLADAVAYRHDVRWYARPLSCKCRSPLEALSVAAIRVRGLALETRALASRALPARCYVDTASRDLPKAAFAACRSRSVTAVCSPAQLSVLLGSTHVHDPDSRGRIRRLVPPCQPGAREGASLLTSPWRRGHANANGPTAMLFSQGVAQNDRRMTEDVIKITVWPKMTDSRTRRLCDYRAQ